MSKTVTEKQLAANRANAEKSTGPKTKGGKYNSSGNGAPHSALANSILIPGESRPRFYRLLSTLMNQYQPTSAYELDLVETMAVARWRTQRNWTLETAAMTQEHGIQSAHATHEDPPTQAMMAFHSLSNPPRSLEALSLRELRYDRVYHRAADRLARLQEKREKQLEKQGPQKTLPKSHYVAENAEQSPDHEPI